MTATGPTGRSPHTTSEAMAPESAGASSAAVRAGRMSMANMLRSILPLVLICLAVVGWMALRQNPADPVHQVDPSSTVRLAAARADYPLVVPTGLSGDYRPTSARTDAGAAAAGAPVTLEIGYFTPSREYAGFVVSNDPKAAPVHKVLDGAHETGTLHLAGSAWTRSTTAAGETALSRVQDGVTVVVSGSASDAELETVAGSVRPYSG